MLAAQELWLFQRPYCDSGTSAGRAASLIYLAHTRGRRLLLKLRGTDPAGTRDGIPDPGGPRVCWRTSKGHKRSVDNVHTIHPGLARTPTGLARIPHVSATSQCSKAWHPVRVPSRAQDTPLAEGVFALTCVHSGWSGPSDTGRGVCLAPRVACLVVGERVQVVAGVPSAGSVVGLCVPLLVRPVGRLLSYTPSWVGGLSAT